MVTVEVTEDFDGIWDDDEHTVTRKGQIIVYNLGMNWDEID